MKHISVLTVLILAALSTCSAFTPRWCQEPCEDNYCGPSTCMTWRDFSGHLVEDLDFGTCWFGYTYSQTIRIDHTNQQEQHCVCSIEIICPDDAPYYAICYDYPCDPYPSGFYNALDEFTIDTSGFPNIEVTFSPRSGYKGNREALLIMYYQLVEDPTCCWSAAVCLTGYAKPGLMLR
ncbi:MAG TPA: hypothetical protein PLV45_03045 [bacterium]|nr:hypothetical protein [bacterium]